jgi:DICT domain-containing protein
MTTASATVRYVPAPVREFDGGPEMTIREVSARTGVHEGTLRMWETRYGFPNPRRLPSGHRRYSSLDIERIRSVLRGREQGISLKAAIDRARRFGSEPRPSVYSAVRTAFPHLQPQLLPKRTLVPLSQAIEDECAARADRPMLFACFQHERFYRKVQARWSELARTAEAAVVLADFLHTRETEGAPAEVALEDSDPLLREWVVVCDAPGFTAGLVGWERLSDTGGERCFETLWTVEPAVVREAARVCCGLAARSAPRLAGQLHERLAVPPAPTEPELRAAVELTTRMISYATRGHDHQRARRRS